MKYSIGIDIGGTNTEFGIINRDGKILDKAKIKTKAHSTFESYIFDLISSINKLISKNKIHQEEIAGIGIGAPNGNYFTGSIVDAPNLKWKGQIPLAKIIKEKMNIPVWLTNDANAAGIGEKIYGGAKDIDDFIIITLGTGLGSAFFANGSLINGSTGFAGELGHTIYEENGRKCGCGRSGCLEQYVSATGIVLTFKKLLKENAEEYKSEMEERANYTAFDITEAARKGDKLALQAFDYTAKVLGFSLSNAVAITSPKVIFLFGGLAQSGDLIIEPTKKYMARYLLNIFQGTVDIRLSELPESNAALLGASSLVWLNQPAN